MADDHAIDATFIDFPDNRYSLTIEQKGESLPDSALRGSVLCGSKFSVGLTHADAASLVQSILQKPTVC